MYLTEIFVIINKAPRCARTFKDRRRYTNGIMEAIKFEKVYFSYEDGEETENRDGLFDEGSYALDGVDFTLEEGEFVAVLGHNGSGKSTLARLCNGLLSPNDGKITVFGEDTQNSKKLFEIRKQVGIVFQNPDNQTVASIVEDDIAFGPENIGVPRKEIGERIEFALNAVGMTEFRHATPTRLSGGQKQRIAIAGVLALKPRVMILDEATAMLDPRGRKEVMDVVLRLNREEKITVLLITHFPEEALLADRAVVMHKGKIVMQGKPEEILTDEKGLDNYSLALPRPVRVCRGLTNGGLPVLDGVDEDGIADNFCNALKADFEILKTENNALPLEKNENMEAEIGKIVCENLSYVYNAKSPFATFALNGVNLQIEAGDFFGIIGHTGSGKSTFVQHLNALLKVPTAEKKYKEKKQKKGEPILPKPILTVNGFDLTDKKTDFQALRSKVGMVFQYPEHQLFAESVFEDVAFGLKNFKKDVTEEELKKAVKEAVETVGLNYDEVEKRSPFELSGGQRRRVAIAGVIVTKPEILVLDEPAAGLDPLGKAEIMSLLHTIHADWCKTVVIVSHDMDEIAENCNRAAIFSEGKIVAVDTPKALFEKIDSLNALGLDVPFCARLTEKLKERNIFLDNDYTVDGFVRAALSYAAELKTKGTGTPLSLDCQGGADNA